MHRRHITFDDDDMQQGLQQQLDALHERLVAAHRSRDEHETCARLQQGVRVLTWQVAQSMKALDRFLCCYTESLLLDPDPERLTVFETLVDDIELAHAAILRHLQLPRDAPASLPPAALGEENDVTDEETTGSSGSLLAAQFALKVAEERQEALARRCRQLQAKLEESEEQRQRLAGAVVDLGRDVTWKREQTPSYANRKPAGMETKRSKKEMKRDAMAPMSDDVPMELAGARQRISYLEQENAKLNFLYKSSLQQLQTMIRQKQDKTRGVSSTSELEKLLHKRELEIEWLNEELKVAASRAAPLPPDLQVAHSFTCRLYDDLRLACHDLDNLLRDLKESESSYNPRVMAMAQDLQRLKQENSLLRYRNEELGLQLDLRSFSASSSQLDKVTLLTKRVMKRSHRKLLGFCWSLWVFKGRARRDTFTRIEESLQPYLLEACSLKNHRQLEHDLMDRVSAAAARVLSSLADKVEAVREARAALGDVTGMMVEMTERQRAARREEDAASDKEARLLLELRAEGLGGDEGSRSAEVTSSNTMFRFLQEVYSILREALIDGQTRGELIDALKRMSISQSPGGLEVTARAKEEWFTTLFSLRDSLVLFLEREARREGPGRQSRQTLVDAATQVEESQTSSKPATPTRPQTKTKREGKEKLSEMDLLVKMLRAELRSKNEELKRLHDSSARARDKEAHLTTVQDACQHVAAQLVAELVDFAEAAGAMLEAQEETIGSVHHHLRELRSTSTKIYRLEARVGDQEGQIESKDRRVKELNLRLQEACESSIAALRKGNRMVEVKDKEIEELRVIVSDQQLRIDSLEREVHHQVKLAAEGRRSHGPGDSSWRSDRSPNRSSSRDLSMSGLVPSVREKALRAKCEYLEGKVTMLSSQLKSHLQESRA
ncbi:hypothetical protein GUITHDRAFT_119392 [Guillardia theta CCMP2712]|uniref:Uncharacterized protein n=1 Tax=Guillardia theta (strain CCMP2712) TaxID=905079 RepID=L1IEX3_GUITC|nr:hypothetical protein GUITHDRAFT_119392 [Guillardia theta CCMP2712]EKX34469.1 hypothetical protein GUITHDRAFT_119392 [Guillardia theta CCMP2712]|eukprot:XP_005821449.1 hypothetical protein GUITHDRAFT_119392 [Guillardia theta CCMP2712]